MEDKLNNGLQVCVNTAKILKEQFPNDIMKIDDNTIIYHSVKNSRLIGGKKNMGSMSNSYAYYTKSPKPRIVIKQKYLINPKLKRTKIKNQSDRVLLDGNFALVELMCHELAHHRTTGHAKSFKLKYKKLLCYMTNLIISGRYYQ